MSAGLPNSKQVFIHGFITANGQKMSKSLGNVINPFDLVQKYGTDAVRYYLLREIVPTEDGDFTFEKFEQRYNSDLAAGIGNLVSRVIGIAAKSNPKSQIPNPKKITNQNLKLKIKEVQKNFKFQISNFKFNEALASVWEIIGFCDKYINEEKLWETKNFQVINDLFYAIEEIGILLEPFLPETSDKIKKAVKIKKSENLFSRIVSKNDN